MRLSIDHSEDVGYDGVFAPERTSKQLQDGKPKVLCREFSTPSICLL